MSENKITEDKMTRKINTNENVGYEEQPLDDDFVLNGNKTENVEKTVGYKSIVKRKLFSRFFIRIFDLVVSGIAILLLLIPCFHCHFLLFPCMLLPFLHGHTVIEEFQNLFISHSNHPPFKYTEPQY